MRLTCIHLQRGVLFLLFACLFFPTFAQRKNVTYRGTVVNAQHTPLEGVSVTLKSGRGVSTDAQGNFTIEAPEGSTVVVSSIGYQPRTVTLKGNLMIRMDQLAGNLDDVVVVGYGAVRKKDLTGSVAVVNVGDAKKNASYDVAKMLQGQAAGISVHGSGEPGGFVQIKIRGTSTFGNNSPLFVIDGVPVDNPYDFPTDDIETLQVLKDASAAAIYGSRAATGVIIITTKKGKAGPPRITFTDYIGKQDIAKRIPVTDRAGYQKIVSAAETNAKLTLAPANDPSNPSYVSNINTDWQKAALKSGLIQDHNLGISGGSENVSYQCVSGLLQSDGDAGGTAGLQPVYAQQRCAG
ncbi:TonB-dependent receptor plug domain-containing protein [Puia sp. P3]|uniref:TonB-dependent receptor plug domain-containing protein n=1 Tax=Puia sp. P3 TaxID=3423952 RepID=UPI003D6700FE